MTELIDYSPEYAAEFKQLNLEWLDQYGLTESHDLAVLDDPIGTIIQPGGRIFLARHDGEIIGTAAIINEGHGVFELAKMAVAPAFRGRGISKLLINRCLEEAKALGATKIILYSNSQLTTAIALYTKFGFTHVPVTGAPFLTADIKMELSL